MSLIRIKVAFILSILGFSLVSCNGEREEIINVDTGRWYSLIQVNQGDVLFQSHCAVCHGALAQGLAVDWRVRDINGNLPPPPLNGTAHTWHHPLELLDMVIAKGGTLYEGNMPSFEEQLDKSERLAVIAYFQSLWSDEIYETWLQIERQQTM